MADKKEKIYDGWLVSDSFLKRAFATWGHMIVAQLIAFIILVILFFMIGVVEGLLIS